MLVRARSIAAAEEEVHAMSRTYRKQVYCQWAVRAERERHRLEESRQRWAGGGRLWTRAPCAPGRQARGAPLRRQQRGRRRARRRGLRLRLPRRLDGRRRSGLRHRSPLLSARTVNALQLRRRGSAPGPTPPAPRRAAGCPRARAPPTHDVARGRVALQPQATPLLCGPGQGRLVSASPNPTHGTRDRSIRHHQGSSPPRVTDARAACVAPCASTTGG